MENEIAKNKTYLFIDAEYVIQGIRALRGKPKDARISIESIAWNKIQKFVSEEANIDCVFYYSAELDESENVETYQKQKNYLTQIKYDIKNVVIRLGKMKKIKIKTQKTWEANYNSSSYVSTWIQKGVDVRITMDMIISAINNEFDTAILIAGDSDFEEVLKQLKIFGKRVELVTFDRYDAKVSESLWQIADKHHIITYEIGKNKFWLERLGRI